MARHHRTIALIGTSGVGKSEYLMSIGAPLAAEMDNGLGTAEQLADSILEWIVRSPYPVVATSVHRTGWRQIAELRKASSDERLERIRFVYLFCERSSLKKRLVNSIPARSLSNIESTVNGFDEMDQVFRDVMHDWIDTTNITTNEVADRIKAFL